MVLLADGQHTLITCVPRLGTPEGSSAPGLLASWGDGFGLCRCQARPVASRQATYTCKVITMMIGHSHRHQLGGRQLGAITIRIAIPTLRDIPPVLSHSYVAQLRG